MKHGHRTKDLTGRRFGLLVVQRMAATPTKGRMGKHKEWECRCDCGNMVIKDSNDLQRKLKLGPSCGCIRGKQSHKVVEVVNPLDPIEMAARDLYLRLRTKHRRRWRATEVVDFLTFFRLIREVCTYCGAPPNGMHTHPSVGTKLAYNGLDRIRCEEGYSRDNVLPACGPCNIMRMDQPLPEFLARVRIIASRHPA